MHWKSRIAAIAAAALALFAPISAVAQKISDLPAAATLSGSEQVPMAQGSGCATHVSPCASAKATLTTLTTFASAGSQPLDSDLTAIAALTTTSYGRSLLTQANAGAAQSTLGLVIGTNVQAYDADLTTYASITPSSNVQSVLGAANYAAISTLLGLHPTGASTIAAGTGAGTSPTISITNGPNGGRITLTTGTLPTLNGVIATVTYASAFPTDSFVVFSAANAATAAQIGDEFADGSASGFVLTNDTGALTASTQYIWDFYVTGK